MAEMSSWDRLAHWTFSSLENLVGTGQGTGTVFGPPKGATWADWRNNDNWAQPGERGGVPVEYTGGGTADTGVPLDSRWLEVNPKSDMIAPNQQVYIGPGARKPDWPGARKPWVDPDTGRRWDPSVESGAPRPTWVDPDTRRPFNPGGGGPAGPAGGPGGGVVVTPLGPRPIVTGTPYVGPGGVGTQGGDPFTEADNMPRDTAPANWDRGPQDRPLGAGDWRNDPSQDPFPRRQPGSNIQINPSGKPWDPNWAPSSSWGMPEHRIGGGSIRRIDYPSLKKELQDRKQM